jgi:hypothetical protein
MTTWWPLHLKVAARLQRRQICLSLCSKKRAMAGIHAGHFPNRASDELRGIWIFTRATGAMIVTIPSLLRRKQRAAVDECGARPCGAAAAADHRAAAARVEA